MSEKSSETVQSFARFVASKMGLHFPKQRLAELAQKMEPLARSAGYGDLEAYLLRLCSSPLSQEQMKELAAALTIGETYFLRDPQSYRVLEDELLPALVAARRSTDKQLRIWSAGCSSGEEPYTIAILLSRALPDLADWKVTLVGSDINPQALERARRGTYTKWSFRNAPTWLMEYFTEEPDGSYRIVPHIREMVRFVHLNLADPKDWSSPLARDMDVIFCRNVMLYFHAELIKSTVARFHASLKSDGWLFVGPTEIDHQALNGFTCKYYDRALVLKKTPLRREAAPPARPAMETRTPAPQPKHLPSTLAPQPPSGAMPPGTDDPVPTRSAAHAQEQAVPGPERETPPPATGGAQLLEPAQDLYRAGRYEQAALAAMAAPDAADTPEHLALAAHAYANIGRFAEARRLCERAIELDRLSARNHHLLSIILENEGDAEGAVASLKRALYIDHDYLLAYFALGNLCRQRGELKQAQQNFANALRLLKRRDPHEVLPDAEGMTAGVLAQLITDMTGKPGLR